MTLRILTAAAGSCLLALAAGSTLSAAPVSSVRVACGNPRIAEEAVFLNRQVRLIPEVRGLRAAAQDGPSVPTSVGEIAIVEADSDVFRRPFDLSDTSVTITLGQGMFEVARSSFPNGAPIEDQGVPLTLQDDDYALIELPFEFPYYGETYTSAYVHSDGNVSFQYPEASSYPRSYSRAAHGPPRIAPLFRDLDPSKGGQVRVDARADALTVVWYQIPVFSETSIGQAQTFQVSLDSTGKIEFRYQQIDVPDAVVGIFSGNPESEADPVDWSAAEAEQFDSTHILAEVFISESQIDELAVTRSFFRTHEDAYDALIVFNDFDLGASTYSLAHAYTVRNEIQGIGDTCGDGFYFCDYGFQFGSPRRLQAMVNMGSVSGYPATPLGPIQGLPHASMLTILAHELGHRFLAYTRFRDPETGTMSASILGRQLAHWSFFFNTSASVLEGNAIKDNGTGVSPRFVTTAATQTYSMLDQYLMGLRDPNEVPATFLVANPIGGRSLGNPARSPQAGVEFDGIRKEIRVEDIIDAEGARRPDASVSQRKFSQAFVLVVEQGKQPKPESLRTLNSLRRLWLAFFRAHLESRAVSSADLVRMLHLSTWPAGGVVSGCTGTVRATISAPRDTDLLMNVRLEGAIAEVPATATIPAGETQVEFEIQGLEPGVTTLTAEAAEAGYDSAVTRFAVRDGVDGLTLESLNSFGLFGVAGSTADEPARYLVRDENLVPYSGVELEISASGGEVAELTNFLTDASGRVEFEWSLVAEASLQTLTARITGAPETTVETQAVVSPETPSVTAESAANAASGEMATTGRGFAPGSLVTVSGAGLSDKTYRANTYLAFGNPTLPLGLGDLRWTTVNVGGGPAPIVEVTPSQVTFQIPYEVNGDSTQVSVTTPFGKAPPVTIPIGPAQPGIFPDRVSGGVRAAVFDPANPDGAVLPRAGGLLELFATGLGAVSPPGRTGHPGLSSPNQRVVAQTEAWVDGKPVEVTSSALAIFEAGVYRVVLTLPDDLIAGDHVVKIGAGGYESNEVPFESE